MVEEYKPEHTVGIEDGPSYWLPDKVYQLLKWAALIALPAIAVLLNTVLPVWGVNPDTVKAIVVTLNAIALCAGALIGVSQIKAK